MGFLGSSDGKVSICNAGNLGLTPWLGRSPWRRERLPTSVFWPREFHGLYSPWGHKELDTTERVSLSLCKAKEAIMSQKSVNHSCMENMPS